MLDEVLVQKFVDTTTIAVALRREKLEFERYDMAKFSVHTTHFTYM